MTRDFVEKQRWALDPVRFLGVVSVDTCYPFIVMGVRILKPSFRDTVKVTVDWFP